MKQLLTVFAVVISLPILAIAGDPVNETCPISGKAINPEITMAVGEHTIGLCCNGCVRGFKKWDEERQLTYIAEQTATQARPQEAEEPGALLVNTPYLLDVCPISGKKLGSIDDPIVEIIDGREVRFCSAHCPEKFKKNKKSIFAKLDKLMIAQQLPFYPTNICVVMGDDLDIHGSQVDFIYGNRLFRTCCNDCKDEFIENPGEYVEELDAAIIAKQKKTYPLTTCVIGTGALDGMGGPDYFVVGNRLVQLCCDGCRSKVLEDPLTVFAAIDAAKK